MGLVPSGKKLFFTNLNPNIDNRNNPITITTVIQRNRMLVESNPR